MDSAHATDSLYPRLMSNPRRRFETQRKEPMLSFGKKKATIFSFPVVCATKDLNGTTRKDKKEFFSDGRGWKHRAQNKSIVSPGRAFPIGVFYRATVKKTTVKHFISLERI